MDDFERELKVTFLDEAHQIVSDSEQNFLSLETKADPDTLNTLFRLAHNLKGSSRAVGFTDLGEFTHVLESLLLKLKEGTIQCSTPVINILLQCNDHLRNWIDSLKADLEAKVDSHELQQKLVDAIAGKLPTDNASSTQAQAMVEEPRPEVIEALQADSVEMQRELVAESVVAAETSDAPPSVEVAPVVEPTGSQVVLTPVASVSPAPPTPTEPIPTVAKAAQPDSAAPKSSNESGKPASAQDESIRVSSKKLERLLDNVGELVILQTVLNQQGGEASSPILKKSISQLSKLTKEIQDVSMSLKMVPLKALFQKMQRIVRDVSQLVQKDVDFVVQGENTELDKSIVELLGDPLVHLVRNAVDHGIEKAEMREKSGKPLKGHITLRAYYRGGQTIIEVQDDGKGLNADILRKKALEKGIIRPNQSLTDSEAHNLIFHPGFSTNDQVTEISGRGVGMDVVRTNIEKNLQGRVELETKVGKGTCVRIILPLTLAIIDGMLFKVGKERYIVPLSQIHESLQPGLKDVSLATGVGEVLNLRGESLPLFRLQSLLGSRTEGAKKASEGIAVVVRSGSHKFSILVDDILGQQQVVIKQLGKEIQGQKGISGGAVLGDGRAALILDLVELFTGRVQRTGAAA